MAGRHGLDPPRFVGSDRDRPDVDDLVGLLAGDLRPVVRVGGVRQVFVLLELIADGPEEIIGLDAARAGREQTLDRVFLSTRDDALDQGPAGEVLHIEGLFVSVGVGHFEILILFAERVHGLHGQPDEPLDGFRRIAPIPLQLLRMPGEIRREVFGENVLGRGLSGRSILILTSSRPGRSTAGSMRSCRLLAPITMTLRNRSTPSISDRNWGTIVDSMSEEMPLPRVRKRASISSKNTITG